MRADSLAAGGPPSALRVLAWCIAVLLITAALMPLAPRLAAPSAPTRLEIAGPLHRVDPDAVRRAVASHLHADFYALDLAVIRAAVETVPWVARARVERVWPAAIRVHVHEHRAVARWGAAALLSAENVVFQPAALDAELAVLPRLDGPADQAGTVRTLYEALREGLAATPFAPQTLVLSARGEWTATTADGIELRLGRGAPTDVVARIAGPVHTALEQRLQEVAYVDLHYFNGFAVGWRIGRDDAGDAGPPAENGNE